MYFLIIFLLVFFTLNPILKKFKKSKNIESIEHAKKFITENENIIKYSFYSDDIIYTILLLIISTLYYRLYFSNFLLCYKYNFSVTRKRPNEA